MRAIRVKAYAQMRPLRNVERSEKEVPYVHIPVYFHRLDVADRVLIQHAVASNTHQLPVSDYISDGKYLIPPVDRHCTRK